MNKFLNEVLNDKKIIEILNKIQLLRRNNNIFPKQEDIFRSLELTNLDNVKVVIFGQDPYYQQNVADGLAFSTRETKTPASLANIFKEIKNEYPKTIFETNDLTCWAKQGVLLLNTSLTVIENKPNSLQNIGWHYLIEKVIHYINNNLKNVVFLLWGNNAKKLKNLINENKHFVLESSHPSPLSVNYGFFQNGHFTKTNEYLIKNNIDPIDWSLTIKEQNKL